MVRVTLVLPREGGKLEGSISVTLKSRPGPLCISLKNILKTPRDFFTIIDLDSGAKGRGSTAAPRLFLGKGLDRSGTDPGTFPGRILTAPDIFPARSRTGQNSVWGGRGWA